MRGWKARCIYANMSKILDNKGAKIVVVEKMH